MKWKVRGACMQLEPKTQLVCLSNGHLSGLAGSPCGIANMHYQEKGLSSKSIASIDYSMCGESVHAYGDAGMHFTLTTLHETLIRNVNGIVWWGSGVVKFSSLK